ncbi:hypothetical protein [Paenibacillus chitinolyticus]
MKKIIPFPHRKQMDTTTIAALQNIEKRFDVSFGEYMGFIGDKV